MRRILRVGRRFPVLALGIVLICAVVVVRVFRDVRVGWIMPDRIGHFSFDAAFVYALEQEAPPHSRSFYCLLPKEPISNSYLLEMYERNLTIRKWPRPICLAAQQFRIRAKWLVPPARVSSGSRDPEGLLRRSPTQMEFNAAENQRAQVWLSSLGWSPGEPFVCLLVRDSAYLDAEHSVRNVGNGWRYHDYRDSSIDDFVPSIEWLADQGVWVIRMGKVMSQPVSISRERVIDYAFRPDRSDFLDVWLLAHCDLCVSTGVGPDMISVTYHRPVLMVNFLPAAYLCSWAAAVTAPKPLLWRDSGRRLTLQEMFDADYLRTVDYVDAGIEVRALDESALLEVVKEAWWRSRDKWVDQSRDQRRLNDAWELLEEHPGYEKLHGERHPSARISSVWLRQLEDELSAGGTRRSG